MTLTPNSFKWLSEFRISQNFTFCTDLEDKVEVVEKDVNLLKRKTLEHMERMECQYIEWLQPIIMINKYY